MTQWNPELEAKIKKVGDYAETQMKEMLNPDASAVGSTLRMLFRAAASGGRLVAKTCSEAGFDFKGPGFANLQPLVDLAEQNGSTAADKIKKVIAAEKQVQDAFKKDASVTSTPSPADVVKRVRIAKQQNIQL